MCGLGDFVERHPRRVVHGSDWAKERGEIESMRQIQSETDAETLSEGRYLNTTLERRRIKETNEHESELNRPQLMGDD